MEPQDVIYVERKPIDPNSPIGQLVKGVVTIPRQGHSPYAYRWEKGSTQSKPKTPYRLETDIDPIIDRIEKILSANSIISSKPEIWDTLQEP